MFKSCKSQWMYRSKRGRQQFKSLESHVGILENARNTTNCLTLWQLMPMLLGKKPSQMLHQSCTGTFQTFGGILITNSQFSPLIFSPD